MPVVSDRSSFYRLWNDTVSEELQGSLSRWLDVPDPLTNHHNALRKRHPETEFWMLNSQSFNEWKSSKKPSLLWLHGNGLSSSWLRTTAQKSDLYH